jgi:NAD(P)-dependent dehydrogenase (short-subunit alcohol dehydrogenase family)
MSTWFITGVSRGIGRELTEQVLARGDRVAATLRRPEQLDDLKERFGGRLWTRRLDVTDTGEIDRVVREAFADHDRIDVVVSNAGYGVFGVAEDLSDEQVDGMLATNLTGSIQLARRVVPHLREQGGGVLVQLSSMGGHITLPGFAIYHATKWGRRGLPRSARPGDRPVRHPHDPRRAGDGPHLLLRRRRARRAQRPVPRRARRPARHAGRGDAEAASPAWHTPSSRRRSHTTRRGACF